MQEVGSNHVWHEGRVFVLEDHGDDVVPDVPFPLQLSTGPQAFIAWPCRVWAGVPGGCRAGGMEQAEITSRDECSLPTPKIAKLVFKTIPVSLITSDR